MLHPVQAEELRMIFFNQHQARTVDAICARLFPSDELGPGAPEAGVTDYIDRALAGPYAGLQSTYEQGLAALDVSARDQFHTQFADCSEVEQEHLLVQMERGGLAWPAPDPASWFDLLLAHTREGLFSDPSHGGNRDAIMWQLLGFPGVQPGYSAEDQLAPTLVRKARLFTAADFGKGRGPDAPTDG